MTLWVTVLVACLLCYLAKLAGHIVPPSWLAHPTAARISTLLPVSLLAALVTVQTVVADGRLVLDARAVAVAAAFVAIVLSPFVPAGVPVLAAGLAAVVAGCLPLRRQAGPDAAAAA